MFKLNTLIGKEKNGDESRWMLPDAPILSHIGGGLGGNEVYQQYRVTQIEG